MAEKMLITKLVKTADGRADLFAKGHRFPDLKLFDLGDLFSVGLDPTKLETGVELPCRFWALWERSEKLNKAGNPYKDVIALEPIDAPATTTSTDNSELLAEMRAIRALLQTFLESQGLNVEESEVSELDKAFPRYQDGTVVSDNPAEQQSFSDYVDTKGNVPPSIDALREWHQTRHL